MAIGGAFQELGQFLDECEQVADAVEDVTLTDRGSLTADVELTLPVGEATLSTPSIGSDGTLRVGIESPESVVPASDYDVAVEPTCASVTDDGAVRVVLSATAPGTNGSPADGLSDAPSSAPEGDGRDPDGSEFNEERTADQKTGRSAYEAARAADPSESTTTSKSTHVSDNDLPPFRDPELLSAVYDSCETFAEMADELDMDVTAETVRRYMIDFDIHQPNSYATGDDAEDEVEESEVGGQDDEGRNDGETGPTARAGNGATDVAAGTQQQVVLSDGVGLPDDVTVETLIETVKQSNTICEVRREIDVDHQDALDMLQELNLLDLVVGRLATEAERTITREEVVDRLRAASATKSRP
ncbi:hypothetical protein [Halomicrococcus gelatinilyticus]|uniref:hypothetical protein n=1 Tax=Halomicrococcus gelatinilyticus TaxID=1702103 RepID=UPI002E0F1D1A